MFARYTLRMRSARGTPYLLVCYPATGIVDVVVAKVLDEYDFFFHNF